MQEAVASGYCTPEEVEKLTADGKDIPFHTFSHWKKKGLVPKEGSHGWETKLWRRKEKQNPDHADSEDDVSNQGFYLQKSFLFHISQCEPLAEQNTERSVSA